jgi:UDP-N-acetylmuramate: L-alanyl-gamma-D-glutamyl-meso-diaminopimelate ligase
VSQVAKLEQLKPEERLNPEQLMQDIQATGKPTAYLADVDAIVDHLGRQTQGGEVICVFSNGGFGGIHHKLLDRLGRSR